MPPMADEAEGDVLAMIESELRALRADVSHLRTTLDHFRPVIDAYLSPAASGPGAWAVRRQLRKRGEDDT